MDITDSSGETKTYTFKSGSVSNPTKNFEERWFMENDDIFETSDISEVVTIDNTISTDHDYNSAFSSNNDNLPQNKSSSILTFQAKSTK